MLTFEKWGLGRFLNTCTALLRVLLLALTLGHARVYVVDDSEGLGRRFDGIGGLSGGGVRIHVSHCECDSLTLTLSRSLTS